MTKAIKLDYYDIIRRPIITEKAAIANELGKFSFEVSPDADKVRVKNAIEALFEVVVEQVNMSNSQGKRKIFKGRPGVRKGRKKAIVTLKKGQTIDFTSGV